MGGYSFLKAKEVESRMCWDEKDMQRYYREKTKEEAPVKKVVKKLGLKKLKKSKAKELVR